MRQAKLVCTELNQTEWMVMAVENSRTVQTRIGKRQTLDFLVCLTVIEGDRLIGHRGRTDNPPPSLDTVCLLIRTQNR